MDVELDDSLDRNLNDTNILNEEEIKSEKELPFIFEDSIADMAIVIPHESNNKNKKKIEIDLLNNNYDPIKSQELKQSDRIIETNSNENNNDNDKIYFKTKNQSDLLEANDINIKDIIPENSEINNCSEIDTNEIENQSQNSLNKIDPTVYITNPNTFPLKDILNEENHIITTDNIQKNLLKCDKIPSNMNSCHFKRSLKDENIRNESIREKSDPIMNDTKELYNAKNVIKMDNNSSKNKIANDKINEVIIEKGKSYDPSIIFIDVGGILFRCNRELFSKYPNSKLNYIININGMNQETFFIDRNPKVFELILDWHRMDMFYVESDIEIKRIKEEAKYYNLLNNILSTHFYIHNNRNKNEIIKSKNMSDSKAEIENEIYYFSKTKTETIGSNSCVITFYIQLNEQIIIESVKGVGKLLFKAIDLITKKVHVPKAIVYDSNSFFFLRGKKAKLNRIPLPGNFIYSFWLENEDQINAKNKNYLNVDFKIIYEFKRNERIDSSQVPLHHVENLSEPQTNEGEEDDILTPSKNDSIQDEMNEEIMKENNNQKQEQQAEKENERMEKLNDVASFLKSENVISINNKQKDRQLKDMNKSNTPKPFIPDTINNKRILDMFYGQNKIELSPQISNVNTKINPFTVLNGLMDSCSLNMDKKQNYINSNIKNSLSQNDSTTINNKLKSLNESNQILETSVKENNSINNIKKPIKMTRIPTKT